MSSLISKRTLNQIERQLWSNTIKTQTDRRLELGSYSYESSKNPDDSIPTFYRTGPDGLKVKIFSPLEHNISKEWRVAAIRIAPDHSAFALWLRHTDNQSNQVITREFSKGSLKIVKVTALYDLTLLNNANLFYVTRRSQQGLITVEHLNLGSGQSTGEIIYQEEDRERIPALFNLIEGNSLLINSSSLTNDSLLLVKPGRSQQRITKRNHNQKAVFSSDTTQLWWIEFDSKSGHHLNRLELKHKTLSSYPLGQIQGEPVELHSFPNYLYLRTNLEGDINYYLASIDQLKWKNIEPPEKNCWLMPVKAAAELEFECHNFTRAKTHWRLDSLDGKWTQLSAESQLDTEKISTLSIQARDGAKIPITYIKNTDKKTQAILAIVYGTYGVTLRPHYDPVWATLLNNGIALAFVHVRGGGFKGSSWHRAGRGRYKFRSSHDLVDAIEGLKAENRLPIIGYGKSAGGTTVANALNSNPEIFSAVILDRPFLGLSSRISDSSDLLMERELGEWISDSTSSNQLQERDTIPCPTKGIRAQNYPPILIRAARYDEVINFQDIVQYVDTLSSAASGDSPIELRISKTGTHKGEVDLQSQLREDAYMISFLLYHSH